VCAGDGPYTALAVARECGMIDLGSTVALGHTGQVLLIYFVYF
jgi:magnesium-transporting ATPase (P-type)